MTSSSLHGRTALVTGGASGIGRACVAALAAEGVRVHLADVDAATATTTAAETGAVAHVVDLADLTDDGLAGLPDDVDILVNNAGVQHVAALHEFAPERFAMMQRLMVHTPFLLMRHCLPAMYRKGWGRLINISSVHGVRASPFKAAYVAAKHGLEGLSKVAALEGAPYGVTSNCVDPGYVRTALVEGQVRAQAQSRGISTTEVLDEVFLARTAVKRLIEPAEVAAVVQWLCGDHSAHLTGASIPLDGGWTAA
ncbi:3-hydroxybutyrate dehydrogenase [Amycolatopsis palatopharyngis]|uniref:3-hydroxybutyrate dehydrogenase n=1 Tax=Amycolatopsis palatopharyngis TaxID=187982 RepID=UPI000E234469|nr:3-hydroxybutyrate dehydrogenase [Amycolatopsis palatopharyngis]